MMTNEYRATREEEAFDRLLIDKLGGARRAENRIGSEV